MSREITLKVLGMGLFYYMIGRPTVFYFFVIKTLVFTSLFVKLVLHSVRIKNMSQNITELLYYSQCIKNDSKFGFHFGNLGYIQHYKVL